MQRYIVLVLHLFLPEILKVYLLFKATLFLQKILDTKPQMFTFKLLVVVKFFNGS